MDETRVAVRAGINRDVATLTGMNFSSVVQRFEKAADNLQSPLLLAVRLFWGFQFARTGWGKLMNLDRTAEFFASINIPAPKLNAIMAGGTECLGGVLLMLGLFSRIASVPLVVTMLVAYVTADRETLMAIVSEPDKFTSAAPFLFLFASVIVLAFGPGAFSLDRVLAGRRAQK